MTINLTANNQTETRVLEYLQANASEVLAEKINAGKKTLAGALGYAKEEARNLAVDGVACVDDATVFGWIVHYFEEDHLTEKPKAPAVRLPDAAAQASTRKAHRDAHKARIAKREAAAKQTDTPAAPMANPGTVLVQETMLEMLFAGDAKA